MSSSRIDPTSTSVDVAPATQRTTAAPISTPFSQVLTTGANALVAGASVVGGVVGGPVVAMAVREAGGALVGAVAGGGGGGGGGAGGSAVAAAAGTGGGPGSDITQVIQMQRESQSFSLQLLGLQQEVQDENRRFTTVSNVLKTAHDTAKGAVSNLRS
jgi:hypothetical protein